jgi:hypothetical protein
VPIAIKIKIDRSIIAPPRLPCSVELTLPELRQPRDVDGDARRLVSILACMASTSVAPLYTLCRCRLIRSPYRKQIKPCARTRHPHRAARCA